MKNNYKIINYVTKERCAGYQGLDYSDLDIARYWAKDKSITYHTIIALYDGVRMLNLYRDGKPIKESEVKNELPEIN